MISQILQKARDYEETVGKTISEEARPMFHLSSRVGWMNDPNGFSLYGEKIHLFYQYHPYDPFWGPMHWGHAVSSDFLHWEYLPVTMAPDEPYDKDGVFSGSAITLDDGRQLLVYTGVRKYVKEDGTETEAQTQCVAVGDGVFYEKSEFNPVISSEMIPEGGSKVDFRDPKIWRHKAGSFRLLAANRPANGSGQLLLYRSEDGVSWEFVSVFAENKGRLGKMWECPDYFELDGKHVIFVSPQEMTADRPEYHNGNGNVCLIGAVDSSKEVFLEERNQAVDYGLDFYAMQTLLTEDGRRVMIGWMQNWDTANYHDRGEAWFGQMSLPRELSIKEGRLYQKPVRELEAYRKNRVEYRELVLNGNRISLPGLSGRCVDLELSLRPADPSAGRFTVSVAADERLHTDLVYDSARSSVTIDRECSGLTNDLISQRSIEVASLDGTMKMRIVLDRFSMEAFLEDGRHVMTTTIYTKQSAEKILFSTEGEWIVDITKYELAGRGL